MRSVSFAVYLALLAAAGCSDDDGSSTSSTSGTIPSTSVQSPTTDADELEVQVFFVDEDAFNVGVPPYTIPVERAVDAATPAAGALEQLFAGPTDEEARRGLRFVASEATGFTDLRIEGGTAHVTLTGGCSSGGSTLTIADQILPTLVQFVTVDAVKIYDPAGETGSPAEPGDSIPFCLEP